MAVAEGKLVVSLTTPAAAAAPKAEAQWSYPKTAQEALRYRVFLDLHTRGYTMTSGAKFGGEIVRAMQLWHANLTFAAGDFLAYPGDPLLYHAQFTVRCVRHDSPQHPLALAAATRMAHAARKHVVLASVHPNPGGESHVEYVTFAPDIQQSTNRDKKVHSVWEIPAPAADPPPGPVAEPMPCATEEAKVSEDSAAPDNCDITVAS